MAAAGVPADRPASVAKVAPATIVKPTHRDKFDDLKTGDTLKD